MQFGEQSLLRACQGVVSALLLLVHIHVDDALVSRAFALERIAVALKARVPVEERRDRRVVLGRKFEPENLAVIGNVAAVAYADDGAGDARSVQDALGRDMRDTDAVVGGDLFEQLEQLLIPFVPDGILEYLQVFHLRARLGFDRADAFPSFCKKAVRQRPVANVLDVGAFAVAREREFGTAVEQGVLALAGNDRHARVDDLLQVRRIEVGHADIADFPLLLQLQKVVRHLDVPRHVVVPPVELHEVERIAVEPAQASVDDRLGVLEGHICENIEVRHVFRVNLNVVGRYGPLAALQARDERPQKLLDAGVDVAAVEGGEAVADELEEGVHDVAQRLNGGCGFGRQSAVVQCLDALAVIKHAVKLSFAELLYKVASRSLIFLGFSKSSLLQHSCPFGCS